MMNKIFIGPMSKIIVDSILSFDNPPILIPSRRQVDFDNGYVNNWNTESFSKYVKDKNSNAIICRDHSGPNQGINDDNGYESLKYDCLHFDMIHIDPWKKHNNFYDGLKETISMIEFCLNINPNIKFEIGTEQSIKFFDTKDLSIFCEEVFKSLKKNFDSITHIVIQSGTALQGNNQVGSYDKQRLIEMVNITKCYDKLSKEHNGDYIPTNIIEEKFNLGLDSINIAPEFGLIQTNVILNNINEDLINEYWKMCFESKKWVKWVDQNFDPYIQKIELIQICGHYVFSDKNFIEKIYSQIDVEEKIKLAIKSKMNDLNII